MDRLFHLFVLSIFRVGLLQHCIGTALHRIARVRTNFHLARSRITQFPQRGSVRGDSVRIDLPNVSQNVYLLKGVSGPRKFRAGIANSFLRQKSTNKYLMTKHLSPVAARYSRRFRSANVLTARNCCNRRLKRAPSPRDLAALPVLVGLDRARLVVESADQP